MSQIETLHSLLEPTVAGLGYELVGVELVGSKGNRTLRVFIDAPAGVRVEDCEAVSHQVSGLLDIEDPIPGAYHLEVSSPGLDRPIFKASDYERFRGEQVRLRLLELYEGRRRVTGTLQGLEDEAVIVRDSEGTERRVPLALIERARLELEP